MKNSLDQPLAFNVGRMRLTGKNNLGRAQPIRQQLLKPFEIVQKEIGALIRSKTPRESHRENLGIEQSSARNDAFRPGPLLLPALPRAVVNLRN